MTLLLVGCGDPSVTGTVKYKDGSPLKSGMIVLQNDKSQGIGDVQPDGSFELYQFRKGDGLQRGTYKGYITNAVLVDDNRQSHNLIPEKYMYIDSAGIEYDSDRDKGVLNITIDALPPK